jgi:hypothetical protein
VSGDAGPYMEWDGPLVWVPRTVPYSRAWSVAQQAEMEFDQCLRYRGKVMETLLGFARDCQCDEVCELRWRDGEDTGDRMCEVPSWEFEIVERKR